LPFRRLRMALILSESAIFGPDKKVNFMPQTCRLGSHLARWNRTFFVDRGFPICHSQKKNFEYEFRLF
jgi:hypothetical protein